MTTYCLFPLYVLKFRIIAMDIFSLHKNFKWDHLKLQTDGSHLNIVYKAVLFGIYNIFKNWINFYHFKNWYSSCENSEFGSSLEKNLDLTTQFYRTRNGLFSWTSLQFSPLVTRHDHAFILSGCPPPCL